MTTLTYRPSSARLSKKPRVQTSKFGDGYEQRQNDGINANLMSWNLTFGPGPASEMDAIEAIFDAAQGVNYIDWVAPGKATARYVVDTWDRDYHNQRDGESTITATLREVPA